MAATESPEQTTTTTRPPEGRRFGDRPATTTTGTPASGRATASLVLGILSIPGALIPILGLALGVIGLIMGLTARGEMRRAGLSPTGKTTAGVVLSCIGIALAVIFWVAAAAIQGS